MIQLNEYRQVRIWIRLYSDYVVMVGWGSEVTLPRILVVDRGTTVLIMRETKVE